MAKPNRIELPGTDPIPILYEDRSVLAIDKPPGWMLVPYSWQKTNWNLQAAIVSSIGAGDFWARSRGLKFLRFVHRLDADTSGVLMFAKSQGAVEAYSRMFEGRRMEKTYLAVVANLPKQTEWTCRLALAPDPKRIGLMKVDARNGKEAETRFRVLQTLDRGRQPEMAEAHQSNEKSVSRVGQVATSLIEARPLTGRTHQIRVHLKASGLPVLGDEHYGQKDSAGLALRAVRLVYTDPFARRRVEICAPTELFLRTHGFAPHAVSV